MRKILFILFTLAVLTTGCSKKDTFVLKGAVEGLLSDTIWVFYRQPDYKLDTIVATGGKFTYTIHPDTFTVFSLLLDEKVEIPVFADKDDRVILSGTPDRIQIEGKGENERMAHILQSLEGMENNRDSLMQTVDSLIHADPYSYANIYLIDKYYAQDTLPRYEHIAELVKGLSGVIKDTPYFIDLQNKLDQYPEQTARRTLSNFSFKDKDGKMVTWSTVKDKYVLLDFWASWDKESVTAQDSLVSVQKALKKEKFAIISLSLDLDKDAWMAACQRDTTQWKQVCDFKGWDNAVVKKQNITRLPANLLIAPDRKIVARDIRGQELIDRVKQLIKQDKEKEKAAKEAEKARKKQNRK